MDDSTSLSSLNSADFILINKEQPQLKVAAEKFFFFFLVSGEIVDLEKNMAEILNETSDNNIPIPESNPDENFSQISTEQEESRPDLTTSVLFHGVTYLGSSSVNAPRSEDELHRNMAILNEQSKVALEVTLCVPDNADGVVRLLDPQSEVEIMSYRVSQILFCARGPSNSPLACCWAFTASRPSILTNEQSGKNPNEILYQCQIFRCENQDAIYRILLSFANAFRRTSVPINTQSSTSRRPSSLISQAIQATVAQLQPQTLLNLNQLSNNQQIFDGSIKFRCYFDIKEENIDNKGNVIFTSVPRPEKDVFNLRKNVRKNISVTLQQIRGSPLNIDRCFGLLLAQGRNVRASDMQLLDLETMGKSDDNRYYVVRGYWNPLSRAFKHLTYLNEETPKGARIFLTVALDIVISGISEPVRFLIEAKARINESNKSNDIISQDISDTIWSSFKKVTPFTEEFDMIIKQVSSKNSHQDETYEVIQLESKLEAERRAKLCRLTSRVSTTSTGDDDDNDEIIISGFGHVSKECNDEVLSNWSDILIKWRKNYSERPKGLQILVQKGIPEALRGEVWQLLAGSVKDENEMINTYRLLLTKESASERIIINDLNRTFPAHEYFKEQGGIGQETLYKLSRAYSVRDEEVGYCQGLSFVIATLLIHMPEEQAFMLLCKLMEDERYLLREMYKANFENLQMKFYQLNCLIEDNLPDIYAHFYDLKVECHMFASQWFLTLFTAKFPLYLVFRIMDIFLYEGFNAIFAVALALLKCNQKDLLSLDFEGVMRYFRVNLPKKYLCEDHADELIQTASSMKISGKKLKRYEKEYLIQRAEEEQKETPLQRLEADNKRLTEACMRSEFENEILALELVNDRIKLKGNLHQAEDQIEHLTRELEATKITVRQNEEHAIRLNEELEHIREAFRDTCDELQRTQTTLHDYKQICSQLNHQIDEHKEKYVQKMESIHNQCCESCRSLIYSSSSSNVSTPEQETINNNNNDNDNDDDDLSSIIPSAIVDRLHRVEIELAEKKLALTEALCENQELMRQVRRSSSTINESDTISLSSNQSTNQNSTVSWLSKTVNTIKEAANAANRTKTN
ncbi:unnamed protein product [Rotaria sordida]|uniref:Rab-GAP TBC domain-containing protein n=2 Tax=Rotaria sordida TaxID=392033 RepID=A0A814A3B2_9BILA|nr:unnamed protein product [Rotaria sordida]CAF0911412.1 unnamed protein product [Rotaria sordida]